MQAKEAAAKRTFPSPADAASVTDEIEGVSLVQSNHGVTIHKLPSRWIGKLLNVPAVLLKEVTVYCITSSYMQIWRTLVVVGLVILVAGICGNLLL